MSHMGPSPGGLQQFHRAHRLIQRTTLRRQRRDPTFDSKGQCYTCGSSHILWTIPSSILHQKVRSLPLVMDVEVMVMDVVVVVEVVLVVLVVVPTNWVLGAVPFPSQTPSLLLGLLLPEAHPLSR